MKEYNHLAIEKKWQKEWEKKKLFEVKETSAKPKWYSLIEFPYPSGDGLHIGHVRSNTAMDVISRKRRMEGFNVLYPIGWDAFGLPTENYAIKTGIQPAVVTKTNTDTFRRQLKRIGFSFDWSREINTTDPKYYKWTQWIFLQMFKKGLAYKKKMEINWCPKDKIGLANEEVINGCCERCGTVVEKREKEQWMLAITKYADRLDKDLDTVDFLPKIKIQQRNWIGKSEGAEIDFTTSKKSITVFTTRPDTLFGVTFIAVSPELAKTWMEIGWIAPKNVQEYIEKTLKERVKGDFEEKEKTGVSVGFDAINPANKEKVPVWIVNYVLGDVGTGAIMGVPAHDERDFEFARKYKLSIKRVINDTENKGNIPTEYRNDPEKFLEKVMPKDFCFTGNGLLMNSGSFTGRESQKAKKEITKFVGGQWKNTYKLRDWVFSRQRYWGEPIPLIYCEKCGWQAVPEKDLPVVLPKVDKYQPTDTGESPLANISKWVNTKCPKCKGNARRETDTMPNWAGSSWYYLRYTDPKNKNQFADLKHLNYWTPVDWYNGGMEHTTLHLLYSRFWHKFLYDMNLVPTSEPYTKRTSHGLILGEGGEKMSKSIGNVINPDEIVDVYGADTLRVYEMFMGPFDQAISWDTKSISGSRRFIERVWRLQVKVSKVPFDNEANKAKVTTETLLHKTIKKVTEDIETMSFNTAISSMMILVGEYEKKEKISRDQYEILLALLSPFAPHMCEELWQIVGNKKLLSGEKWPIYDPKKIVDADMTIVVQVNGKVRGQLTVSAETNEDEVTMRAEKMPDVDKWLVGKKIVKKVYIAGRIVNFVVV